MSCFDNRFYVVAGDNKVVALNCNSGKEEAVYTITPASLRLNFWPKSLFYFTTTFFTSDHFV